MDMNMNMVDIHVVCKYFHYFESMVCGFFLMYDM